MNKTSCGPRLVSNAAKSPGFSIAGPDGAGAVGVDDVSVARRGGGLFMIAFTFIKLLSTIGVAYFAITLSHTLLHDKKWRWLPALVMFCALSWGVNYICSLFPSAVDQLVMIDVTGTQVVPDSQSLSSILVPALLPTLGVSVAVIAASLFGSAHLLKKSVSL